MNKKAKRVLALLMAMVLIVGNFTYSYAAETGTEASQTTKESVPKGTEAQTETSESQSQVSSESQETSESQKVSESQKESETQKNTETDKKKPETEKEGTKETSKVPETEKKSTEKETVKATEKKEVKETAKVTEKETETETEEEIKVKKKDIKKGGETASADESKDFPGAGNEFLSELLSKALELSGDNDVTYTVTNGLLYGTKELNFPKNATLPITMKQPENAHVFNILWNSQTPIELTEYKFVNQVPESIQIPIPIYIKEGEADPNGWVFDFPAKTPEFTNTKINIKDLRTLFTQNEYSYTYARSLRMKPEFLFSYSDGTTGSTANNITWTFKVPMSVEYTVDIAAKTNGGSPGITAGLDTTSGTLTSNANGANSSYWRAGDINNTGIGGASASIGTGISETSSDIFTGKTVNRGYGNYGTGISFNPGAENGYYVAGYDVTKYDALSGSKVFSESVTTLPTTIEGKTEIRVRYGKTLEFGKVDKDTGEAITSNPASFEIYKNAECTGEAYASGSSDDAGKVYLNLEMPDNAQVTAAGGAVYYMKETIAPNGYDLDSSIYKILLKSDGSFEISGVAGGGNFDNSLKFKNKKLPDPTITKSSNPVTGSHVQDRDEITYTLTVSNPGKEVRKVTVEDTIPAQLTAGSYMVDGVKQTGNWTGSKAVTVPAAVGGTPGTVVIQIETTVNQKFDSADTGNNTIVNKAVLKYDYKPGKDSMDSEVTTHYLDPKPSYTLTKTRVTQPENSLPGFIAGDGKEIVYEAAVTNTGDVNLNISLKDLFNDTGKFIFKDDVNTGSLLELKPGETKNVPFTAKVLADTEENVTPGYKNVVSSDAVGTYTDAETGTVKKLTEIPDYTFVSHHEADAYTPVIEIPDPTITKTSDKDTLYVEKDGFINYTITVTNTSRIARNVTVTDTLPEQLEAVGNYQLKYSDKAEPETVSVPWNNTAGITLPPAKNGVSGTAVITIRTKVKVQFNENENIKNVIPNYAELTFTKPGASTPETPDKTPVVTSYLKPSPSYVIQKSRITQPDNGKGFIPGAEKEIQYQVTVQNTGNVSLTINLEDKFAEAGFTILDPKTQRVTVAAGDTLETPVIFKATVNKETLKGDYLNTVTGTSSYVYTDPKTNTEVTIPGAKKGDTLYKESTETTPVILLPPPTITKEGSKPDKTVTTKSSIIYTLTVTNEAEIVQKNVTVNDAIPKQLKVTGYTVTKDGTTESFKDWTGSWTGDLPAKVGEEPGKVVIKITAKPVKDFYQAEVDKALNKIVNTATLTYKDENDKSQTTPPTNEVVNYLEPVVSYELTKERLTQPQDTDGNIDGFIAGKGTQIQYEVTLKNTGNVSLEIALEDLFKDQSAFQFHADGNQKTVTVNAGKTKKVNFVASVKSTAAAGNYENTVSGKSSFTYQDPRTLDDIEVKGDKTGDPLYKADTAETPVVRLLPPSITKTSPTDTEDLKKGDTVTYVLTVQNPSIMEREVTVSDLLPEQLEAKSYTVAVNGAPYPVSGVWEGSWKGTLPAINGGKPGEAVIRIFAEVKEGFYAEAQKNTITNQAALTYKDEMGGDKEKKSETVVNYLTPTPNYTLTKVRVTMPKDTDKNEEGFLAGYGTKIKYQGIFENTGNVALTIALKDVFEKEGLFTFDGKSTDTVTLTPGEKKTVEFFASVNADTAKGNYKNTITATTEYTFTHPVNGTKKYEGANPGDALYRTADAETPVIRLLPPTLTKTSIKNGQNVGAGEEIIYNLTATNPSVLDREVTIKDALPTQVTAASYTVSINGETQNVTGNWSGSWKGTIPAGGKVEIAIKTTVNKDYYPDKDEYSKNKIVNTAEMLYKGVDGKDVTTPGGKVTNYLTPKPDFEITKTRMTDPKVTDKYDKFVSDNNTTVDYEVVVKNTGNIPLEFSLKDVFETGKFTFVAGKGTDADHFDQAVVNVPAGDSETVTFSAKVDKDNQSGDHKNIVTAHPKATYRDPDTGEEKPLELKPKEAYAVTPVAVTIWVENPTKEGGQIEVKDYEDTKGEISSDGKGDNTNKRKPTNAVVGTAKDGWQVDVDNITVKLPNGNKVLIKDGLDSATGMFKVTDEKGNVIEGQLTVNEFNKRAEVGILNMKENIDVAIPFIPARSDLTLTKTNEGGDQEDVFDFLVTLGDEKNSYIDSTYVLNGETKTYKEPFTVQLKGGEQLIIGGIKVNTPYSITETENESYVSSSTDATGVMTYEGNKSSFVNTAKEATLTISKSTIGGFKNDTFTFEVTINEEPYSGPYMIGSKHYTMEDGELTLKGGQTATIKGLKSGENYTYEVKETDSGFYKLTNSSRTSGTFNEGSKAATAKFVNTYIKPDSAKAVIEGKKYYTNGTLTSGLFKFELSGSGITTQTVSNDSTGKFTFSPLSFSKEGTYNFTLREVNNGLSNVTYDTSSYSVKVEVTFDKETNALNADITYNGNSSASFTNVYKTPTTPTTPTTPNTNTTSPKTGDNTPIAMLAILLALSAGTLVVLGTARKRRRTQK